MNKLSKLLWCKSRRKEKNKQGLELSWPDGKSKLCGLREQNARTPEEQELK